MSKDNSKAGWKRVGDHREGCLSIKGGRNAFVVPASGHKGLDFRRKKNGDRGGSTLWHRFVCNDLSCDAEMLVRWDVMSEFVSNPPRES